jgi:hypothetical protein
MAYVGTPLDTTNAFQSLAGKRFNGDGSTTDFTLDSSPNSTLDIEVFVGNVRQDPNSAYTVSGTTLAFTGAPPSGTNNIYVVHQAKAVGTIDPAVGSTLDLNGAAELILDADADTSITADTDDQIDIKIGGNDDFKLTAKTLSIGGAAAADSKIVFDGNAQDFHIGLDDSADDLVIGLGSTLGTTSHIVIDEAGHITKPLQSACLVQKSANQNVNSTSLTVVSFDTEKFDQNADYGSNTFTAPVTGKYLLTYCVDTFNAHSGGYLRVDLVTSNTTFQQYGTIDTGSNEYFSREFSAVCDMDASDTAQVKVLHSNDTSWGVSGGSATATTFSACLLA